MKAVLVISEMPSRCGNCPLLQQYYDDEHEEWYEVCFWRQCKIEDTERKLNICPLKPMPTRRDGNVQELVQQCCSIGFNACLEQLIGEDDGLDQIYEIRVEERENGDE